MSFAYDGLNRQVARTKNGNTTFSVWDGWNLIEGYGPGGTTTAAYAYGAGDLIADRNLNYYYQDASGSTSHLADSNGNLLEWYRYDLQGTPVFYDANSNQISASAHGVRHLFTGQQWYSDVGLYDLRNRFYSPDIGRFLQPDPIGFRGGNNLYRYCGNNPVRWRDPSGLANGVGETQPVEYARQIVTAPYVYYENRFLPGIAFSDPSLRIVGGGWPGIPWGPGVYFGRGREGLTIFGLGENDEPSVEHSTPSSVASQNPPTPDVLDPAPETPLIPIYQASQSPPATSVTIAFGPGGGFQITVTHDMYGQTFLSFGGQVGKSLPAWPVSVSVTGDYIIGQKNPSAAQIAKSMRGFGWSASGGYWAGGQLGGPATPQIFLPSVTGAGAGAPSYWGGGFVSPQIGVGLGYTWQLPTLASPLPPYSPTSTPEDY